MMFYAGPGWRGVDGKTTVAGRRRSDGTTTHQQITTHTMQSHQLSFAILLYVLFALTLTSCGAKLYLPNVM